MGSCIHFTNPTQRVQIASPEACAARLPFSKPRRSIERLVLLANDSNPSMRLVAAGHPKTPHDVLRRLAVDFDSQVRAWVARNPAVPPDIVEILCSDDSPAIRAYARLLC